MKTRFAVITGILLFTFFGKVQTSHAQLVFLKTDSIIPLDPIIMNDFVDFEIHVGVKNIISLLPDVALGNIFYWYRTDSMISSGQPARIVDFDLSILLISDGYIDTVPIEMLPNELRTGPVNLIILWPAMINPLVLDTVQDTLGVLVEGFLSTPNEYPLQCGNIIFPCPAIQFVNIQSEEIKFIDHVQLISMSGQVMQTYRHEEFQNGSIDISNYPSGEYVVQLHYYDNRVVRTKILKH